MVHEKPKQRNTWAYHAIDGWCPSLDHYRCFKCFIPSTGGVRDANTVKLMPRQIPFPKITTEDYLLPSATDILHILKNPPPSLPSLSYGDDVKNVVTTIAQLLQCSVQRTKVKPLSPPLPTAPSPPRVRLPLSFPAPRRGPPRVARRDPPRVAAFRILSIVAAAGHVSSHCPITFASPDPSNR